jgi:hypothetical protein
MLILLGTIGPGKRGYEAYKDLRELLWTIYFLAVKFWFLLKICTKIWSYGIRCSACETKGPRDYRWHRRLGIHQEERSSGESRY